MSNPPPTDCPLRAARERNTEPIMCRFVECRYHCGLPGDRGPLVSIRRRAAVAGDDCALTIAARGEHSYAAIAAVLGLSRSAVRSAVRSAKRKRARLLAALARK